MAARAWAIEEAKDVHKGGFARPGGTDQGGEFALLKIQIYSSEDRHLQTRKMIGFVDVVERHKGGHFSEARPELEFSRG
jgi:hypothetical protein